MELQMYSDKKVNGLTTGDLRKRYPYIVAHCYFMGSFPYFVEQQLWQAYELNAPVDVWGFKSEYMPGYKENPYYTISTMENKQYANDMVEWVKANIK